MSRTFCKCLDLTHGQKLNVDDREEWSGICTHRNGETVFTHLDCDDCETPDGVEPVVRDDPNQPDVK